MLYGNEIYYWDGGVVKIIKHSLLPTVFQNCRLGRHLVAIIWNHNTYNITVYASYTPTRITGSGMVTFGISQQLLYRCFFFRCVYIPRSTALWFIDKIPTGNSRVSQLCLCSDAEPIFELPTPHHNHCLYIIIFFRAIFLHIILVCSYRYANQWFPLLFTDLVS